MTPTENLASYDMGTSIHGWFTASYIASASELPESIPSPWVHNVDEETVRCDVAVRPLPRPDEPTTEAYEAIAHFAMKLDKALRNGGNLDTFAFVERNGKYVMLVSPWKVRALAGPEGQQMPLIPVTYSVHTPSTTRQVTRELPFVHVTTQALRTILELLEAAERNTLHNVVGELHPKLEHSCFYPRTRGEQKLTANVRAAMEELASCVNVSCVQCGKKARKFCEGCRGVMYCGKQCQRSHKNRGGHSSCCC